MALDPLDRIADICHVQPPDALTMIAEVLGFTDDAQPAAFQRIDTAPKDGTVIAGWSAREPGILRLAKWGHHLNNQRYAAGWVTSTKSLSLSNVPTHYLALGPLPNGVKAPGAAPVAWAVYKANVRRPSVFFTEAEANAEAAYFGEYWVGTDVLVAAPKDGVVLPRGGEQ